MRRPSQRKSIDSIERGSPFGGLGTNQLLFGNEGEQIGGSYYTATSLMSKIN